MLTTLDKDIADLAAGGATLEQIAKGKSVTQDCVVHHLLHIYRELEVHSPEELLLYLTRYSARCNVNGVGLPAQFLSVRTDVSRSLDRVKNTLDAVKNTLGGMRNTLDRGRNERQKCLLLREVARLTTERSKSLLRRKSTAKPA